MLINLLPSSGVAGLTIRSHNQNAATILPDGDDGPRSLVPKSMEGVHQQHLQAGRRSAERTHEASLKWRSR